MNKSITLICLAVSVGFGSAQAVAQVSITGGAINSGLIKVATIKDPGRSGYKAGDTITAGTITSGSIASANTSDIATSKTTAGVVTIADLTNATIVNPDIIIITVNNKPGPNITAADNVVIESASISSSTISSATLATTDSTNADGVCDIAKTDCIDIGTTTGLTFLKAQSGTYNFLSVSPELRYRFKRDSSKEHIGNLFIAIGSPLVTSLNQNGSAGQTSTPTSIFKSSLYLSFGIMGRPTKLFSSSDLSFAPIAQIGFMSQQIDKTNGIYDKGGFFMLGVTTNLASFPF